MGRSVRESSVGYPATSVRYEHGIHRGTHKTTLKSTSSDIHKFVF
jgi:hypothetical protein